MKKFLGILALGLFVFVAIFYLMQNNNCRLLSHFTSDNCFSSYKLKREIGNKLAKYPTLHKMALKFNNKILSPTYELKENVQPGPESTSITPALYNTNQILLETPFIKGISNSKFKRKENSISSDDDYEYNNWHRSHGGNWNTKFDSGKKINKKNINKLKLVWKYSSINREDLDKKWKGYVESNPVFINNKLITVTPDRKVVALNAENGIPLWEIKSEFPLAMRGILVEYDKKLNLEVLYIPLAQVIYKINAKTGKIIKNFGNNGFVKAFTKVAPIIYNDYLVIVGIKTLFVFNKNTGEFISKIEIHPKDRNFSKGNVWGGAAIDIKKGIVYVATGNPDQHIFNSKKIGSGDNKRANSIIAIDINKKKIIWDFQEISHDLWDFDIASPPIIHNLKINEKIYEVVIAVTKAGNTIILERNTGRPIFDITYRAAPKSKIKGITTSPFQIDLKKPESFSKIEFDIDDIDELSQEKQSEIMNILKDSNYGWFETPSFEKQLVYKGLHGGAMWMGATIDPINQNLFIPVNNIPWIIEPNIFSSEIDVQFPDEMKKNYETYVEKCSSCHGIKRNGKTVIKKSQLIKYLPSLVGFYIEPKNVMRKFESIEEINNKHNGLNLTSIEFEKMQKLFNWWDKKLEKNNETYVDSYVYQFLTNDGLPASNPPWGYIAKLDLVSGKILYRLPVGNLNIKGKEVTIGTPSYGGTALNGAGILFVTGTEDFKAYAFDSNTGETLWSYEMEAAGSTPPIIFNTNGKQYVSFLATGGVWDNSNKKGSTLYTFTISD